jgi:magnesium chelatase subunit I
VLAKADGGVLYVDEVNLLPDHLVDLLLDVAASGVNLVERDGISHRHPARFVLIGTMNPEEGELRPQLLDRFGLNVALSGQTAPQQRGQIIRRRLDFDAAPEAFCEQWAPEQQALKARCENARARLSAIELDDLSLAMITERCFAAGVDGLRADLVWLRAARAHAAWRGETSISEADIDAVADFALRHRRQAPPPQPPASSGQADEPQVQSAQQDAAQGQRQGEGSWGAMPARAVATGARREVPIWPKKP